MAITRDDARTLGEQDASTARGRVASDGLDDRAMLAVSQIADGVPAEYRQAYLDGAAGVLGSARRGARR